MFLFKKKLDGFALNRPRPKLRTIIIPLLEGAKGAMGLISPGKHRMKMDIVDRSSTFL